MIETERLRLRQWRDDDRPALAALNADPVVRRWFTGTLTREESNAQFERLRAHVDRHKFGFWALEIRGVEPCIGFVGLQHVTFDAPFAPAVETGWRLAARWWGRGYATEAARACLAHGFGALGLSEIVAFTAPENIASRRVMERIGMTHDPDDDFDHPAIPPGHPMRRHVLYRVGRPRA